VAVGGSGGWSAEKIPSNPPRTSITPEPAYNVGMVEGVTIFGESSIASTDPHTANDDDPRVGDNSAVKSDVSIAPKILHELIAAMSAAVPMSSMAAPATSSTACESA
jgi:hypothetical protein